MRSSGYSRYKMRRCSTFLSRAGKAASLLLLSCSLCYIYQHSERGNPVAAASFKKAALSASASVAAAGRGNPHINIEDGHDLLTAFTGAAATVVQALEANLAQPLALASADFDEDGAADLAAGYAVSGQGAVALLAGNVDAVYPNSAQAQRRKLEGAFTEAPFLSPAAAFAVAKAPDFLAAGDYNGDGHSDIVAAARQDSNLYLLPGDGKGNLASAKTIKLPGRVTALASGEMNRRDGLDDLALGVRTQRGDMVIVFQAMNGALNAPPEIVAERLPAEVTGLALSQLDDRVEIDLAVAAGSQLVIVYGRDKTLALDETGGRKAEPVRSESITFQSAIKAIAAGDFAGNNGAAIAMLTEDGRLLLTKAERGKPASQWGSETLAAGEWSKASQMLAVRASSFSSRNPASPESVNDLLPPSEDLLLVDAPSRKLHIVTGRHLQNAPVVATLDVASEPRAVLPMRLNRDALNDLVILRGGRSAPAVAMSAAGAVFAVTTTHDNGSNENPTPGSLRDAILKAESAPGADTIVFDLAGAPPYTISPPAPLPRITEALTIDGTSQRGFAGAPIIELSGASLVGIGNGLELAGGGSVVRGLVINRFKHEVIAGIARGGNGILIYKNGRNIIEGNFLGTDAAGRAAQPNTRRGVRIGEDFFGNPVGAPRNLIGGTAAQARNVISGNGSHGIFITSAASTMNAVQGNYIGTDATGLQSLGNFDEALEINSEMNLIGGLTAGARNVIAARPKATPGCMDESGRALPGCTENGRSGIEISEGQARGNLIQGNYIGIDKDGAARLPHPASGILIWRATATTVGGSVESARNVISGNDHHGVVINEIAASDNDSAIAPNIIQGNYIGTDATGTKPLGNARSGILVSFAEKTFILDNVVAASGLIATADGTGVHCNPDPKVMANGIAIGGFFQIEAKTFGGKGSLVQGNFIGTNRDCDPSQGNCIDLGNCLDGIFVENNSLQHVIKMNTVAFNKRGGVCVPNKASDEVMRSIDPGTSTSPGKLITMCQNAIFSNGEIGIDLGEAGVTENQDPSATAGQANDGQNFPELTSAVIDSNGTTIEGSLKGRANRTFTIEFFSNSIGASEPRLANDNECRQGQRFIGTITVTSDASGNVPIKITLPSSAATGFINATASEVVFDGGQIAGNNTSEFSACVRRGPSVREITALSKITVRGFGFASPVRLSLIVTGDDGQARELSFSQAAKVKNAKTIIQGGQVVDEAGRLIPIQEAIPAGRRVLIKIRNGDGGETVAPFRN